MLEPEMHMENQNTVKNNLLLCNVKKTPLLVFTFELDKTPVACDQLFYKTGLITTKHLFLPPSN